MRVFLDRDADLALLSGRTVAVIGYGSQGHAHANNLRDSGVNVVVGLRRGSDSWGKAVTAGLTVMETVVAARAAEIVMLLVPDEMGGDLYARDVAPAMTAGKYLAFGHGFNVHFKRIVPPPEVNVFLVAPKGPGRLVRSEYQRGSGVACLVAVHQDPGGATRSMALAYAKAIGGTRTAVLETTFKEETETDLFGEQAVLCGGLTELIRAGYETLVAAGYAPEMAYFECLHEVKLIADLVHERGIARMREAISNTAEYGDVTRGRRVIGPEVRRAMEQILAEIQSGRFAEEWVAEYRAGLPNLRAARQESARHEIEAIGERLRTLMRGAGAEHGQDSPARE